ncbi:hypothetical protein M0R45_014315 [Rubus argutus]|uniref:Uncharacterized protein n=1 Tax=Rubus argutus TaxID=59490 RepID=A0AAW1XLW2_RUBAR
MYLDYSVPWTELTINSVISDFSLFHHYSKFLFCPPQIEHGHGFGPADELARGEKENGSDPFASLPHGFMKRNRVRKALWTMSVLKLKLGWADSSCCCSLTVSCLLRIAGSTSFREKE